ncbi:MAG: hypothetical protein ABI647_24590, partial [Gemmatimonadota bacterium]
MSTDRLDRLEIEHLAGRRGLPGSVAAAIGAALAHPALGGSERTRFFEELIAHFEDGLAAGRPAEELVADFGDPAVAAALYLAAIRVPAEAGPMPRRTPINALLPNL